MEDLRRRLMDRPDEIEDRLEDLELDRRDLDRLRLDFGDDDLERDLDEDKERLLA